MVVSPAWWDKAIANVASLLPSQGLRERQRPSDWGSACQTALGWWPTVAVGGAPHDIHYPAHGIVKVLK